MRRFLVLLLLTLTAFQLAFAGLPVAAAAVQLDSHCVTSGEAGQTTVKKTSHGSAADQVAGSQCDTPQDCTVCGTCQLCHQAAHPDAKALARAPQSAELVFPPTTTRYLSAEHAPSLKPPIL